MVHICCGCVRPPWPRSSGSTVGWRSRMTCEGLCACSEKRDSFCAPCFSLDTHGRARTLVKLRSSADAVGHLVDCLCGGTLVRSRDSCVLVHLHGSFSETSLDARQRERLERTHTDPNESQRARAVHTGMRSVIGARRRRKGREAPCRTDELLKHSQMPWMSTGVVARTVSSMLPSEDRRLPDRAPVVGATPSSSPCGRKHGGTWSAAESSGYGSARSENIGSLQVQCHV
jgi:hypothetical protein